MKIAILGYSGSGKSTLARFLGTAFNIPIMHLDAVHFQAGWKVRDKSEALAIVSEFMTKGEWVIDGNYSSFFQPERLEQADYIFCLKFSRIDCLWRAFRRFMKYRNTTRYSMAEGCKEKFDLEFVWWILYEGRRPEARNLYEDILNEYGGKSFIIKNQRQLNHIMNNLSLYIK